MEKNTIYIGNSNEPISILNLAKKIKQITKSQYLLKSLMTKVIDQLTRNI